MVCVQSQNDVIVDVNSLDTKIPQDNENIMFIVSEEGGHCGWPLGWNPARHGYARQTAYIIEFVEAMIKFKAQ